MALFGPQVVAGLDPSAAYGVPNGQPAGGTTFTDLLNSLTGAGAGGSSAMGDISNGLQTLAYGIGGFAKDPARRAMYLQAAAAHQQHMSADKAAHLKALTDHGNEILGFIQQAAGHPQALNALQPVLDHQAAALRALGGGDLADQFLQTAQAIQSMPPPAGESVTMSPGQQRIDLATGKVLASVPDKTPTAPGAVQEYQFAQGQGFKGTFQDWQLQQKQAGAQRNSITMNNMAPRALLAGDEEMMKKAADDYTTARSILPVFDIAGKAAANFPQTGITGDAALVWERGKNMLGLDNNAPAGEALRAMQTRMGVLQRMPGSGSTSDMEMSMYMQAVPSLSNTPQGNQFLATVGKKLAQRKIDNYLELRSYYSKHNGDLSGFVPDDKPILDARETATLQGASTGGAPPAAGAPGTAPGATTGGNIYYDFKGGVLVPRAAP